MSHRKHLRVKGWLAGVDLIMSENIEIHENGNGVTNPGYHPDNEDEKKVLTSSLILLLLLTVAYLHVHVHVRVVSANGIICSCF